MKVFNVSTIVILAFLAITITNAEHLRNKNKINNQNTIVLPLSAKPTSDLTKVNAFNSIGKSVLNMCAQGKDSKKILHFRSDAVPEEEFHIQAVVYDKLTGEPASGSSMTVDPSAPFVVDGGVMDVTLNAYPAAVLAGDSDYMVKLQIVDPDPVTLLSNTTARRSHKYAYTRMQQLLDNHYFTRVKVKNCDPKKTTRQIAGMAVKALMIEDGTGAYLKLKDVQQAFKMHLERVTNYSIPKEHVVDFEVIGGDRRGRSELHFKVLYTTKELSHQATLAVADNTGKYIKLLNKALHYTLKTLGVKPQEDNIKRIFVSEDMMAFERPIPSTVCCQAKTPRCLACAAGLSIGDFCAAKPTTDGCSYPESEYTNQTHKTFQVEVRVSLRVPQYQLKFLNDLKLKGQIPSLMRSIQKTFPLTTVKDFFVRGIEVEQPEIVAELSSPTLSVARRMAEAMNEAQMSQTSMMQHLLSDAIGRAKLAHVEARVVFVRARVLGFDMPKIQNPVKTEPCHGHSCPGDVEGPAADHWWLGKKESKKRGEATGSATGITGGKGACCTAMTATCQACLKGETVVDFCARLTTKLPGCVSEKEEKALCCSANNAECLACKEGKSIEAFCKGKPEATGCDDVLDKVCCQSEHVKCKACNANTGVKDYCRKQPKTEGCALMFKDKVCCKAMTASCMACQKKSTVRDICIKMPKLDGCGEPVKAQLQ